MDLVLSSIFYFLSNSEYFKVEVFKQVKLTSHIKKKKKVFQQVLPFISDFPFSRNEIAQYLCLFYL